MTASPDRCHKFEVDMGPEELEKTVLDLMNDVKVRDSTDLLSLNKGFGDTLGLETVLRTLIRLEDLAGDRSCINPRDFGGTKFYANALYNAGTTAKMFDDPNEEEDRIDILQMAYEDVLEAISDLNK